MPTTNDREIFLALRSARRTRWVEGVIFALMLGGLFVCFAVIAIGSIGAAMDDQKPFSVEGDQ